MALQVKNPPEMQETQKMWFRSLGWEDPCRTKWQPTAVFLPGKLRGERRSLGHTYMGCRVGRERAANTN